MRNRGAFTLAELLVTVAVICILAALLFPALSATRERARSATCANNIQQIALSLRIYGDDHSDTLPEVSNRSAAAADVPSDAIHRREFTAYRSFIKSQS